MTITEKAANEMTNSHIMVQTFDYYEPVGLEDALALLDKYGEGARVMAGGTHLMTMMKMEREMPQAVISLAKIDGLAGISVNVDGGLSIGALAGIYDIRRHLQVRRRYPALAEACASFGSTQIQIMATVGGNLCNGSPASDTVPALLVYGAEVVVRGGRGERRLLLEDFLVGPGETALAAGEVLVGIELPPPPEGALSAFVKVSRVSADLAKASAAVLLVKDGERIRECRLAFGSVAPTVVRLKEAEGILSGEVFSQELLASAGEAVSAGIAPIDDIRSTAWYRRQLCKALTVDILNQVWERSGRPFEEEAPAGEAVSSEAAAVKRCNIAADGVQEVVLNVNGERHALQVRANELLLNVLRERLHLTGAKYGCGLGECGACTVLVDGRAVLSCLLLAVSLDGREISTVEGMQGADGELDPLQAVFIEEAAFQCGYCTPGFLMTTKSLLREMPQPDEAAVRDYLKGNRCRCTGYTSILRAVVKTVGK